MSAAVAVAMSVLPRITERPDALITVPLEFVTQCAAVSSQRPLTSVAPQLPSGVWRWACAGHGEVAGVPPTICAVGGSRCAVASRRYDEQQPERGHDQERGAARHRCAW